MEDKDKQDTTEQSDATFVLEQPLPRINSKHF